MKEEIKITNKDSLERFQNLKRIRKNNKILLGTLFLYPIVYFSFMFLIDYLNRLLFDSFLFLSIMIGIGLIIYFVCLGFWIRNVAKLNKEKQQILSGYHYTNLLKYLSEKEYIEYAKILNIKIDIDIEETKEEDKESYNEALNLLSKKQKIKKPYTISSIVLLVVGTIFMIIAESIEHFVISTILEAIWLSLWLSAIITFFVMLAKINLYEKKYENLILSFNYKKYIKYLVEKDDGLDD